MATQWHELLGAVLVDFFANSPYTVETEVDLSLKKQYLDVVVIRKQPGVFTRPLPDGLGPLADYTLLSFKSHKDTFTWDTVVELLGHYMNYRKQVSPSLQDLLPESAFRLVGLSARFPDNLAAVIKLENKQKGVYDIVLGPLCVQLLVIRELPDEPVNALLKLFSLVPEQIKIACQHYRPQSPDTTGIIDNLIRLYCEEEMPMPATLKDLERRVVIRAPVEVRLEGLSSQERLQGLSTQERLEGLSPEQIVRVVPADKLAQALSPQERLQGLSPQEIEAYLQQLKAKTTPPPS